MPEAKGTAAASAYGVSAGLDLLSGVFSYISSLEAASAAGSRADLIRAESEANAQRFAEKAKQFEAHQKMMFIASGVKVSGSVIDVLDTTARIASENIAEIRRAGEREALNEEQLGTQTQIQGRNALAGGVTNSAMMAFKAFGAMA